MTDISAIGPKELKPPYKIPGILWAHTGTLQVVCIVLTLTHAYDLTANHTTYHGSNDPTEELITSI